MIKSASWLRGQHNLTVFTFALKSEILFTTSIKWSCDSVKIVVFTSNFSYCKNKSGWNFCFHLRGLLLHRCKQGTAIYVPYLSIYWTESVWKVISWCALYAMSVIQDLCDAHLKICCLNLLRAEYFFGCWYLLYPAQGIQNQDFHHLMSRGMRIYFFFPPPISYGPLYKQVVYFVTFITL